MPTAGLILYGGIGDTYGAAGDTYGGALPWRTWQVAVRDLVAGLGTSYPLVEPAPEGFGLPDLRAAVSPRPVRHGEFAGRQWMAGRTLRFSFDVLADDPAHAEDLLAAMSAAWAPVDPDIDGANAIGLAVRLGGPTTYLAMGIPTKLADDLTWLPDSATPHVDVEFRAVDPRLYNADLHLESTALGELEGGLGFPHGFPHGFGAATSGTIPAVNDGNVDTPFTAAIVAGEGGLTNPTYEDLATGRRTRIVIDLAEGDTLTVDHDAETVLLNGTVSRASRLDRPTSTWWPLRPGTTPIRFTGTGAGTLTLAWRDAWLL